MQRFDPDLQAILVSGNAKTGEVSEALELGAGPFLSKLFTLPRSPMQSKRHYEEDLSRRSIEKE